MITSTETTEGAIAAVTEPDEARELRQHHVAVIDGLQDLADFLADAGPMSGLTGRYSSGHFSMTVLRGLDGDTVECLDKLAAIGRALGGAEIQRDNLPSGNRAMYFVERQFGNAVTYRAHTTIDLREIDDAAAALAEAIAEQGGAA